jgi:protein-serine/threonine kinase
MKDLLPPSPSISHRGLRHSPAASQHRPSPLVPDEAYEGVYSRAGTPFDRSATSSSERHLPHSRSYSQSLSSSSEADDEFCTTGPVIEPLDFSSIISSHDRTHSALAQTVTELGQWLSVVEGGLRDLLHASDEADMIDEEYDDYSESGEYLGSDGDTAVAPAGL